jgi:hypothetical protein
LDFCRKVNSARDRQNELFTKTLYAAYSEISSLRESIISPSVKNPQIAHEVRMALSRMSAADAGKFLNAAIEAGDDTIASAALSAPSLLTGISSEAMEILRRKWQSKNRPLELERADRTQRAIEATERARTAFLAWTSGVLKSYESSSRKAAAIEVAAKKVDTHSR